MTYIDNMETQTKETEIMDGKTKKRKRHVTLPCGRAMDAIEQYGRKRGYSSLCMTILRMAENLDEYNESDSSTPPPKAGLV